jgi:hypothetical protein
MRGTARRGEGRGEGRGEVKAKECFAEEFEFALKAHDATVSGGEQRPCHRVLSTALCKMLLTPPPAIIIL